MGRRPPRRSGPAEAPADVARLADDMRAAVESRAVVDQALGAVTARNRCTADAASGVLVRTSQDRDVKLRDIAQGIVAAVAQPPRAGADRAER